MIEQTTNDITNFENERAERAEADLAQETIWHRKAELRAQDAEAEVERLRLRLAAREQLAGDMSTRLRRESDERVDLAFEHRNATQDVQRLEAEIERLRGALRGVANAYGCFSGCTGALPGAPVDGSGHHPACRNARQALESDGATTTRGSPSEGEA